VILLRFIVSVVNETQPFKDGIDDKLLRLRFNEVIRVRLLIVGVIEVKLFVLKFKFSYI
jgi:hypothetical protein